MREVEAGFNPACRDLRQQDSNGIVHLDAPETLPPPKDGVIIAGHSQSFITRIGVQGYPYALLVDPGNLNSLSPVIYGPGKIWQLYFLALGLRAESYSK